MAAYHVRFTAADILDVAIRFDIVLVFRDRISGRHTAGTSRKIKAVFKPGMKKGLRCADSIRYGYLASKENKGERMIGKEAAAARHRMFRSVLGGERIARIARARRAEKTPIPSGYWKRIGASHRAAKHAALYVGLSTGYLLKRPEYMGRKAGNGLRLV